MANDINLWQDLISVEQLIEWNYQQQKPIEKNLKALKKERNRILKELNKYIND